MTTGRVVPPRRDRHVRRVAARLAPTQAARRLFERNGFRVLRRNDLERHGVALHNFDMEKDLQL